METLLIHTPEAHKEVFQTYCYSFRKPEIQFRFVGEIIGRGLLFAEGAEHKRQRRILLGMCSGAQEDWLLTRPISGLFSVPNLKKILPVFQERAVSFVEYFDKHLDENGKGIVDGASFDIVRCCLLADLFVVIEAYSKLALDVAGITILGVELGNLTFSDPKLKQVSCHALSRMERN